MRKITLFTLSLICAMFMASCSDDASDSYDDATLEVSEKALEYGKEGGQKTFDVTVNEKNNYFVQWENSTNWGEISRNGKTVTVVIEANTTPYSRTTNLIVLSQNGGLQEYVAITQVAAGLIFDAIPDEITFTRLGGENTVLVNSNASDWMVEGEATWLTIEPKQTLGEIKIIAQPNNGEGQRSTVLAIKRGIEVKPVAIIQKGTQELVLPYFKFGASLPNAVEFEQKRGHYYQFLPGSFMGAEEHNIYTLSLLTPKIQMEFTPGFYNKAIVWHSIDKANSEKIAEFQRAYVDLLVEIGFTKVTETQYIRPLEGKEGTSVVAELFTTSFNFSVIEDQPGPMPTFDEFPYGYMIWGKDEADVRAYEDTMGGTLDEEESDSWTLMWFNAKSDDPLATMRSYIFRQGPYTYLIQNVMDLKEPSRVFYVAADGTGFLTREYKALLAKEGFTWLGATPMGGIYYSRPSKEGYSTVVSHRILTDTKDLVVRLNIWEQMGGEEFSTLLRTLSKQKEVHADKVIAYRLEDILK